MAKSVCIYQNVKEGFSSPRFREKLQRGSFLADFPIQSSVTYRKILLTVTVGPERNEMGKEDHTDVWLFRFQNIWTNLSADSLTHAGQKGFLMTLRPVGC